MTLTFNLSVGNHDLPNDIPYQIIPSTRYYLHPNQVISYKGNNKDIIIHVNYLTRPFLDSAFETNSTISNQLLMYQELANRIGSHYILIHLPASLQEYLNIPAGIQLILEKITNPNITILLEIVCFTRDLQRYLLKKLEDKGKDKDSYPDYLTEFMTPVLNVLQTINNPRLKLVIDTAHIFGNNATTYEDYLFTYKLFKPFISDVIHLNGNINPPFCSDEHIPFIDTKHNLLYKSIGKENYDKFIDHVFAKFRIIICEHNFEKYPEYDYNEFLNYATEHKLPIIPNTFDIKVKFARNPTNRKKPAIIEPKLDADDFAQD